MYFYVMCYVDVGCESDMFTWCVGETKPKRLQMDVSWSMNGRTFTSFTQCIHCLLLHNSRLYPIELSVLSLSLSFAFLNVSFFLFVHFFSIDILIQATWPVIQNQSIDVLVHQSSYLSHTSRTNRALEYWYKYTKLC